MGLERWNWELGLLEGLRCYGAAAVLDLQVAARP